MKIGKRNIFRLVWFTMVAVFFVWQWSTYQSRNLPDDTFDNSETVLVEQSKDKITFHARNTNHRHQIIFFQGGLTDPKAYAPLCRQIAENGFTCHLIMMNWRMPQWDYWKITEMFDLRNGDYIVGGHSQGAKMASKFVYDHPNWMKGLFLLGTSYPRDFDLSDRSIPTIKLYAELDGLASVSEVLENRDRLPKRAILIEIKGGNHSQFGYLGKLLTDESAGIDLERQQQIAGEELTDFFMNIEASN